MKIFNIKEIESEDEKKYEVFVEGDFIHYTVLLIFWFATWNKILVNIAGVSVFESFAYYIMFISISYYTINLIKEKRKKKQ